ncbi:MAG: penicillin-binding protein activator [Moraxellaceae bacterium]
MRFPRFLRVSSLLTALFASLSALAAPPHIALLLPQSGRMAKAAESIRDGFLAAYYQDSARGTDTPALRIYDSDSADIITLVNQARADGAGLVIGPLDRERLDALLKAGPAAIPVLALNSTEGSAGNIYQFALSPEDEIQRLAEWMSEDKIRQPLLLATADDASQRQVRLFSAAWQARHESSLKTLMLDPARKGGIVAEIKELSRRGGPYDALFLATPALARQVQPALTYYHNRQPLYSLSSAWDPTADASGQKDLDGLHFCDLPWMLEPAREEQNALYASFGRPAAGYDRLYAFGADAWTLIRHWQALQDGEAIPLRSGRVRADSTRHLRRTVSCAEVRNGTAIPTQTSTEQSGSRR